MESEKVVTPRYYVVSSVRSSSVYHGPYPAQPTFSNFSDSSDSKVLKRPNMCYIFEKHGIQGYQISHSHVSNGKYTTTKCSEDHTCAIFFKRGWFKDINFDHHINFMERTVVLWTPFLERGAWHSYECLSKCWQRIKRLKQNVHPPCPFRASL